MAISAAVDGLTPVFRSARVRTCSLPCSCGNLCEVGTYHAHARVCWRAAAARIQEGCWGGGG
eukprot:276144-Chlamydomonas_euryale.AAC.1